MAVLPRSSYYDKHYKQSAALIRARRPYLVKNALVGLGLFGFVISVYSFTIKAVSQDDFEDVKVPDAPITAHTTTSSRSKHYEQRAGNEVREERKEGKKGYGH